MTCEGINRYMLAPFGVVVILVILLLGAGWPQLKKKKKVNVSHFSSDNYKEVSWRELHS